MNISLVEIAKTFRDKLNAKYPRGNRPKTWSNSVFTIFAEMGLSRDMCCWVTKVRIKDDELEAKLKKQNGGDLAEYLVDMCWTSYRVRTNEHKRIEVAIESEWSRKIDELKFDFYKLLDVNAPKKIFICDLPKNPTKKEKVKKQFMQIIKAYDKKRCFPEDEILLIDINYPPIFYTVFNIKRKEIILEFELYCD